MGRSAEGWKLWWKRGHAYVRFTWNGHEHRIALRTEDAEEAATRAARAYADVVSGRLRPVARAPGVLRDLGELWDEWVTWKTTSIDHETATTLGYYGDRFVDYFRSLDRVTDANCASYVQARLGQVTRSTVLKERCFFVQFLKWCKDQHALAFVPDFPAPAKKATGKRSGKQRARAVEVTPREAARIIEALPVESKKIGARRWPIRARFAFTWEVPFRPETIARLSVPENWNPSRPNVLTLTDEDDKARYGRAIDLHPAAVRILRACAPELGVAFGAHEFSKALKRAARTVLDRTRAKDFAPYDFRHSRARAMLDAGASLRGVAYVLGHTQPSTTDRYVAPSRREGKAALRAV